MSYNDDEELKIGEFEEGEEEADDLDDAFDAPLDDDLLADDDSDDDEDDEDFEGFAGLDGSSDN
jgi:hypothetical protein